jgi:hypothetical protein
MNQQRILCVEEAPKHVPTIWVLNITFDMPLLLLEDGLCLQISRYFLVCHI